VASKNLSYGRRRRAGASRHPDVPRLRGIDALPIDGSEEAVKDRGHALGAPETHLEARIPRRWSSVSACICGITLTGVSPVSPVDAYDRLVAAFEDHIGDAGPRLRST
jgi:hypothetical protein